MNARPTRTRLADMDDVLGNGGKVPAALLPGPTVPVLGALPAPTSANRGQIVLLQGSAGQQDLRYLCRMQSDGSYQWDEF